MSYLKKLLVIFRSVGIFRGDGMAFFWIALNKALNQHVGCLYRHQKNAKSTDRYTNTDLYTVFHSKNWLGKQKNINNV